MPAKSKAREVPTPSASAKLTIGFGLVNVPISLKPLLNERRAVSARTLCRDHLEPVQTRWLCGDGCEHEHHIATSETVRGYPVPGDEDRFVVLDEDALDELVEQRTGRVELERIVPVDEIDPLYLGKTYLCWPRDGGEQAFDLLADALRSEGRAALATCVLTKQTQMLVFRWASELGCVVAHICHFSSAFRTRDAELVRQAREARGEVDEAHRQAATMLLMSLAGEFDPSEVDDTFTPALVEAIKVAANGQPAKKAKEPAPAADAPDLIDALRASIAQARKKEAVV